jgi:hypothetical protein
MDRCLLKRKIQDVPEEMNWKEEIDRNWFSILLA